MHDLEFDLAGWEDTAENLGEGCSSVGPSTMNIITCLVVAIAQSSSRNPAS